MRSIFTTITLFLLSTSLVYSQSWENSVHDLLQSHYSENNFEGVVLIAVGNEPVLNWACGIANRDSGQALDMETRFALGELTHYLTAIEVLIMADEERLSLTDTLSNLLPHLSLPHGNSTTVEHLLKHTSGYPEELEGSYAMRNSPRIIVERALEDKSRISAMGTYRKSNLNYLLLGMIIKEVTAQTWRDAMREDIISNLSLENTGFLKWDEYPENWAKGYTKVDSAGWQPVDLEHIENYQAAGAMYSTVADLLKIERAIQSGQLPDPISLLQSDVLSSYPQKSFASFKVFHYPFAIDHPLVVERSSSFGGAELLWISIPSTDATIILMSNLSNVDINTFGNLANLKEQLILKMSSCGNFHIEPCEGQ